MAINGSFFSFELGELGANSAFNVSVGVYCILCLPHPMVHMALPLCWLLHWVGMAGNKLPRPCGPWRPSWDMYRC